MKNFIVRNLKIVFQFFLLALSSALLSSCVLNANISDLVNEGSGSVIALKIKDSSSQIGINDGSTLVLLISQTAPLDKDTVISFTIEEDGFSSADTFQESFPITKTLKAGETIINFTLNTKHDPFTTGNKNFILKISSDDPKIIGTQLDLKVLDLEAEQPTLTFSNSSINEGQNAQITFNLSKSTEKSVTFNYSTQNGTALAGAHYATTNGSVTFPPGSTLQVVTLPTIANSSEICAPDRSFTVAILNLQNAQFTGVNPVVTLKDPDRPVMTINNSSAVEGSAVTFTITLSALCSDYDVTFDWQTLETTALNNVDFTVATGSGVIPKGSSSVTFDVATLADTLPESSEAFSVTLSNILNATTSGALIGIGTIVDDDFGSFTISGITSTGDIVADAYLNNSANPSVNWSSASGATNYDVSIYEDDGVTLKCAIINTASTSLAMSSCNLNTGLYYKAVVIAKSAMGTRSADNSLYRFYVNQSPISHPSGSGPYYVLAGNSIVMSATGGSSPTVGIAQDPEGGLLSITAIGTPTLGTISSSSSSSFTLSTVSTHYGESLISVTISDSLGGTLVKTIQINVVQPFTWTGAVSSVWSVAGNWCGSVSADKRSCVGAASGPSAADIIYFDDTCSSTFTCSPIMNTNLSVAGIRVKANGFSQGTANTITVGGSDWIQQGGTFNGGNGNIQLSSSLRVSGVGGFYSTTGIVSVLGGTISFNENFIHNNGTVSLNTGTNNFASLSDFYNLSVSVWTANGVYLVNTIVVQNNLDIGGGGGIGGSFQFEVRGNLSSIATQGSLIKIKLVGTNNQAVSTSVTGYLPHLIIEKTGGSVVGGTNLNILNGGIEVVSGAVDFTTTNLSISGGSSEPVQLAGNAVRSLLLNFWSYGSLTLKDNIVVNGDLTVNGAGIPVPGFVGVKISVAGNVAIDLANPGWGGPVDIEMLGAVSSDLSIGSSGGTIAGTAFGGDLIINKSSGASVRLLSNLSMAQTGQDLIINAGSFDMNSYNVSILGLSLNSTALTKNSGVLTVGGVTVGSGSLYGGTINP